MTAPLIPPPPQPLVRSAPPSGGVILLVATCWGLLAALGAAIPVGILTFLASTSTCTSDDSWCELGAVIFGALAGVVAALLAYVVAGIVTIVRRRPAGERATLICLFVVAPVLASATLMSAIGLF